MCVIGRFPPLDRPAEGAEESGALAWNISMPAGDCSRVAMAMCGELDKETELEGILHCRPQVTPLLNGSRCRSSRIGALSCASTDSGPPSPALSVQLSPPFAHFGEPLSAAGLVNEPALASVSACELSGSRTLWADRFGPQFEPKASLLSNLPEHYHIYGEGELHPKCTPVLRVRGTFVEYVKPTLHLRRSRSAPALGEGVTADVEQMAAKMDMVSDAAVEVILVNQWMPGFKPNSGVPPPPIAPPPIQLCLSCPPPPPDVDFGESIGDMLCATGDACPTHWISSASSPTDEEVSSIWVAQLAEATHAADGLLGQQSSDVWYYQPCYWQVLSPSVSAWMSSQKPDDYDWPSSDITSGQAGFCRENASSQAVPLGSTGWLHNGDEATFVGQDDKFAGFLDPLQVPQNAGEYPRSEMSTKLLEARPSSTQETQPMIQMQHSRPTRSSFSGSETQRGGRKSSTRKAPPPDEQWALEMIEAARSETGIIWEHARRDGTSSATVQTAFELVADQGYASGQWDNAHALISGMQGRVRQAFESPFGNYVLSKIFEVMPTELVQCLAEELRSCAVDAARHRFGCRCMVRLIRHHCLSGNIAVLAVIQKLVAEVSGLSRDQFGTHVVQELVDSGLPEHRQAVAKSLRGSLHREAKNRFTGRLVEKALQKCDAEDVQSMADELLGHKDGVRQLIDHEAGSRVVKVLLSGLQAQRVAAQICSFESRIGHSHFGKLALQEARFIVACVSAAPDHKNDSRSPNTPS